LRFDFFSLTFFIVFHPIPFYNDLFFLKKYQDTHWKFIPDSDMFVEGEEIPWGASVRLFGTETLRFLSVINEKDDKRKTKKIKVVEDAESLYRKTFETCLANSSKPFAVEVFQPFRFSGTPAIKVIIFFLFSFFLSFFFFLFLFFFFFFFFF